MQSIFKVNLLQFCNTSSLFLLLKERFCPTKIGKKKTPPALEKQANSVALEKVLS